MITSSRLFVILYHSGFTGFRLAAALQESFSSLARGVAPATRADDGLNVTQSVAAGRPEQKFPAFYSAPAEKLKIRTEAITSIPVCRPEKPIPVAYHVLHR